MSFATRKSHTDKRVWKQEVEEEDTVREREKETRRLGVSL